MINEVIKQESIELAHEADNMITPSIVISPLLTITVEEWKRVIYSFIDLKNAISEKLKVSFTLNIIDFDDHDAIETLINIDRDEDQEQDLTVNDVMDGFEFPERRLD
jgi:hypothetical protein